MAMMSAFWDDYDEEVVKKGKSVHVENNSRSSLTSCCSRVLAAVFLVSSTLPAYIIGRAVRALVGKDGGDDHGKKRDDDDAGGQSRHRRQQRFERRRRKTLTVLALTSLVASLLAAGSMWSMWQSSLIRSSTTPYQEHRQIAAAVGAPTDSSVLQQLQHPQQKQKHLAHASFLRAPSSTSVGHNNSNSNSNEELPTYEQLKMLNFGFEKGQSLFRECRDSFLRNRTWGNVRAPFVDKFGIKQILEELGIPNLKIVPTFAIYRRNNVTEFYKDATAIRQMLGDAGKISGNNSGIIIKPSHTSGGVARITSDGYYECFKRCHYQTQSATNNNSGTAATKPNDETGGDPMPVFFGATAAAATKSTAGDDGSGLSGEGRELTAAINLTTKMVMHLNMHHYIHKPFWNHRIETQYASIEPGIIVEPALPFYDTESGDGIDGRASNEGAGAGVGFREYQWWIFNNPNAATNDDENPVVIAFVSWWFYHTDPETGVKSKYIAFYTSDYRPLQSSGYGHMGDGYELVHMSHQGSTMGQKPATWETMYQIASDIGRRIVLQSNVGGAVRLDLFASDDEVYFGELTFTSKACTKARTPLVVESLMYQIMHGNLLPSQVQPAIVERIVNDRKWALLKNGPKASLSRMDHVDTFPSASDLCYDFRHDRKDINVDFMKLTGGFDERHSCLKAAEQVYNMGHQQRCVIAHHDNSGDLPTSARRTFTSFGMPEHPSFDNIVDRVDWEWACGIIFVVLFLHFYCSHGQSERRDDATAIKKKLKKPRSTWLIQGLYQSFMQWYLQLHSSTGGRFFRVVIYLTLVVAYKLMKSNSNGLLNPDETLFRTCFESFKAFVAVHPAHSHYVAFTHLATYWFEVMAWVRASCGFKDMLFWYFMYEVVTSFVNEDAHFGHESDVAIKCMRASFIAEAKQYALNDVVRAYLLPPFFCYCYLLPKFICIWSGKFLDKLLWLLTRVF